MNGFSTEIQVEKIVFKDESLVNSVFFSLILDGSVDIGKKCPENMNMIHLECF